MNCCGQRLPATPPARSSTGTTASTPAGPAHAQGNARGATADAPPADVAFTYTGRTRLLAEGPITRRRYRFDAPGAVVAVDARDAPSLAAVPLLRRAPRSGGGDR